MAFAELLCTCEASMQLDIEDEAVLMGMVLRFANQHVACGYMTPPAEEPTESTQTLTLRRTLEDDDD